MNKKILSRFGSLLIVLALSLTSLASHTLEAEAAKRYFSKSNTIVHAAGALNKASYSNSKQALKRSLKKGHKKIELDFEFTRDGILVCVHNWRDLGFSSAPTYRKFKKAKTPGGGTTMKAKYALKMLNKYHAYLVADTKASNIVPVYRRLNYLCRPMRSYKKKIIPQLYHESDYKKLRKIYNYRNYIYSTYKINQNNYSIEDAAKFSKEKKIKFVALPCSDATTENVKICKKYGRKVAVFTVNTTGEAKKYKKRGAVMVYSDRLL